MTLCERCERRRCSRRKFQPTSISSTASSALRPPHGAPPACALVPLNVYSTDTAPVPLASPQLTPKFDDTWEKRTMSTSLKTPARTNCALPPSSSSAIPGHTTIVPAIFSRSMTVFSASAAVMLSGIPELWPSPWPGAPSMNGS